jgi:hypothetical protein
MTNDAAPATAAEPTGPATMTPDQMVTDTEMMRLAAEADAAMDAAPSGATPKPAAEQPKTASADAKPGAPAAADKPAPENKDAKPGEPALNKTEAEKKAQSDYAKKQGELERRDRSWRALDEEKQKFRAEEQTLRGEVQQLRAELATLKQKPAQPAATGGETAKDQHGMTAADYQRLARQYRAEGRDDMAEMALDRADELRRQPAAAAQPAATAPAQAPGSVEAFNAPEFQQEWRGHIAQLVKEDPALADAANPLVRATNALVQDGTFGRFFRSAPDGIRAAVEVAKLMRTAEEGRAAKEELNTARAELKKLRAEKERLDALTQPQSGRPTGPATPPRTGAEVSDAEMLAIAAAADRGEI